MALFWWQRKACMTCICRGGLLSAPHSCQSHTPTHELSPCLKLSSCVQQRCLWAWTCSSTSWSSSDGTCRLKQSRSCTRQLRAYLCSVNESEIIFCQALKSFPARYHTLDVDLKMDWLWSLECKADSFSTHVPESCSMRHTTADTELLPVQRRAGSHSREGQRLTSRLVQCSCHGNSAPNSQICRRQELSN